jgi:hypothetical protein
MVILPNGESIISTHTAKLPIGDIPLGAQTCHLFPTLTSGSHLSIGQLCDHGFEAIFSATHLHIQRNNVTILLGHCSPPYSHWLVNVPSTSPPQLPIIKPPKLPSMLPPPMQPTLAATNAIVPVSLLAAQVAFYYAALFSPVMSTWCAGHLATWPHLTSTQVWRHFPQSIPMHLGHLYQVWAIQQSTKPDLETTLDADTRLTQLPTQTYALFVDTHAVTGKAQSDQIGRFGTPQSSGHAYLMLLYDFNSNYIHAEPLKSRSGPTT